MYCCEFLFLINDFFNYFHFVRNSITDEGMDLQVSVLEAKGLILPFKVDSVDTFVRIYLVPDQAGALQTKVSTQMSLTNFRLF